MSQALYRRYRSTSFNDVVGQEHVTSLLQRAVEQDAISHAYLFTGPRGVGKTSVARILAHTVNELDYSPQTHLDIIEIDAASNRRIDDVRDLREKVHIAPSSAKYKVYIIDEVHMLTGESFNALLKTLEEPPSHVIFILATTEIHKVPATIVSRTQRFHFKPGTTASIAKHLTDIAKKEKTVIEPAALELIAEHSDGSFRDALSLLDQVSGGSGKEITRIEVEHLLGVAPHTTIEEIVTCITDSNPAQAINLLQKLLSDGISPATIAQQLAKNILASAHTTPSLYSIVTPLLDLQRSNAAELRLLAIVGTTAYDNTKNIQPKNSKPQTMPSVAQPNKPIAQAKTRKSETPQTVSLASSSKKASDTAKASSATSSESNHPSNKMSFTWDNVLEIAQKRAPALYGVLKRAEVTCTEEAITLTFQYALHKKKLSDTKYSSQLQGIIVNSFGCDPEIIITDINETPLSQEATDVAAIMGGGKPVNA